jgi:hypothetical protein
VQVAEMVLDRLLWVEAHLIMVKNIENLKIEGGLKRCKIIADI